MLFAPGQTVGELNVVKTSATGTITITNTSTGPVDLLLDIFGWTSADQNQAGSDYVSLPSPVRAYDSHCTGTGCGTIPAGTPRTVTIVGANVPAGATAVTANVTATDATANGFLTVYPNGLATPNTSNVNYAAGAPQGNGITVKLSSDGKLAIAASGGNPNVIIDITGYYSSAQNTYSYIYNADGNRIVKQPPNSAPPVVYIWNYAQGLPLLAATKVGSQYTYFTYGPGGLPVAQGDGTTAIYLHHDQIGSTRLATTNSGTTVGSWTYDPYGALTAAIGNTNATPLKFAGEYQDTETGFYNLRARLYDPNTGQFLSRDPATMMTRSAYGYVFGDPLGDTDPTGLAPCNHPGQGACPSRPTEAELHQRPKDACPADKMEGVECTDPIWNAAHPFNGGPDIFDHVVVGWGGCFIVCVSVSYQNGHVQLADGGAGIIDKGVTLGWANRSACDRDSSSYFAGGAYGAGAGSSVGVDGHGNLDPADSEVDIIGGVGGYAGRQQTVVQFDLDFLRL